MLKKKLAKLREALAAVRAAIKALSGMDNSHDEDARYRLKHVEDQLSRRIKDVEQIAEREEADAERAALAAEEAEKANIANAKANGESGDFAEPKGDQPPPKNSAG